MGIEIEQVQPQMEESDTQGKVLKNVKEFSLADGSVRIKGGAIIISDETGIDRVLIGFSKNGF